MSRTIRIIAPALLILTMIAVACQPVQQPQVVEKVVTPTPEPAGPVTITFFRFFGGCADEYAGVTDLAQATGECGIIQVLTNKFNAENEYGITVETQQIDWYTYYDRLNATFAGGAPSDIAVMHRSQLPNYVTRGMLHPLGDGFETVGIDVNDFTPEAFKAVSYQDKIYGLPFDVHALLWHINVDLFKEAGLVDDVGSPILPGSPDELLEQAKTVKEKTGKDYISVASSLDPMMVRVFFSLLWQQGSDLFNEDLTQATLNTPEGKTVLDLMKALYDGGFANPTHDYPAAEQAFLNGEAAVLINGTWVVDAYTAQAADPDTPLQSYVVRDFPTLFAQPAVWSDSHMWVVPLQPDPDPRRYEAALRFLYFINDNDRQWARTGHLPVRQSVLESEEFNALPHRSEYANTAKIARAVPKIEYQRAIQDIMSEELQAIWLADKDPQQALVDMETRINDLLANIRK